MLWVAIVLNILSTTFYSRTIKNLALANMTVSDGVSPSPKGGPEPAPLPSKFATGEGPDANAMHDQMLGGRGESADPLTRPTYQYYY